MSEEQGYRDLDAEELKRLMAGKDEAEYELVDVRQPREYRGGHIPGARLVPLGELEARLAELDPDREHVFYCQGGSRSGTASRLASESGRFRGRILNLVGGFTAWTGATLPDAPRLEVFDPDAPARDTLLRAMDLERAAYLFYRDVRRASGRAVVCELMDKLIGMEEAHAKLVHRELRQAWADAPGFEELFGGLRGEVLEGGRTVDELEPWIRDAASGDCIPVAELALEIEASAYDLYRAMAQRAEDAPARDLFLTLARQEKEHLRWVMERLDAFLEQDNG